MSIEITTLVTNLGKEHIAKTAIYGSSFQVGFYELGTGGVDSVGTILAPDPTAVALNTPLGDGLKVVTTSDIIGHCPIWTCVIGPGVSGALSEIGLWAQEVATLNSQGKALTFVPNSYFLYTHGTFGEHNIVASETQTAVVNIQF